jgi:uncharacterized protein with PQ loop repeat
VNAFVFILTWTAQISYVVCLFPQIYLNYKRKSTEGLSDLFLLALLHGASSAIFYVFGLNLPMSYKLMIPIAEIATLVVIIQRIIYADAENRNHRLILYLSNMLIYLPLISCAIFYPTTSGTSMGWVNLFAYSVNLLPQIVKIQLSKSVKGFSYSFILILAIAGFCELVSAYLLNLPVQSCFNGFRNIVMLGIISIQFWLFRK